MPGSPLLSVSGLAFAFPGAGGFRLSLPELALAAGERVVLRGENGAGKSVLLKLLAGLLLPGSGAITGPAAPRPDGAASPACGYAPPLERGFHARLSARENLRFHAGLRGMAAAGANRRIEALAAELGAADRIDEPFGDLSSGLRQRFNLARAMLHAPALLLLDEPGRALDPAGRGALVALFSRHLAAGGALLLATPEPADDRPPLVSGARELRIAAGEVTAA